MAVMRGQAGASKGRYAITLQKEGDQGRGRLETTKMISKLMMG